MILPHLDELTVLALTVKQEAEAEPWDGKLAVAWVIVNRARKANTSIHDVVFKPYQFSCWNTDSPTRARLDAVDATLWYGCVRAAAGALLTLAPDPTDGATFYFADSIAPPAWARAPGALTLDETRVTARIGHHIFMKG